MSQVWRSEVGNPSDISVRVTFLVPSRQRPFSSTTLNSRVSGDIYQSTYRSPFSETKSSGIKILHFRVSVPFLLDILSKVICGGLGQSLGGHDRSYKVVLSMGVGDVLKDIRKRVLNQSVK